MKEKSSIGHSVNGTADLSSLPGFTMVNGEEMIIAEVFYRFTPILNNSVVPTVIIYRNNIYSPRYGSLSAFISHCK